MILEIELHKRLVNWSYYKLDDNGYPTKSTIADFGLPSNGIRRSKPPISINNLKADEMNGWINIMGKEHPEYKQAIGAYYLRSASERIWELAKRYHISPRMFKQRLHDARLWLSGRLSSEVKNKY